jgi:hypothetical protein
MNTAALNIVNTGLVILITYQDTLFTIEWYKKAGNTLTSVFILEFFKTILLSEVLGILVQGVGQCIDRGCRCRNRESEKRTKQLTQHAYEQLNLGMEFDFSSAVSNIIFITFMAFSFGPGLPILYPLAAMNLFVIYWSHKTWLLKFFRKPPNFNSDMIRRTMYWIKTAIFAHAILGIMMYNQPQIFLDKPFWNSKA